MIRRRDDLHVVKHMRPMMVLKGDKSSTTENCTFWMTRLACTGNTTSPKEVVEAPLNPNIIRSGFSKADGGSPICLYADIYKSSVELLGSTKIHLTSNSLIPTIRIRVSSCGCSTRSRSIGGKVIVPSTGRAPPLGKLCWMELTCSLTEATRSSLCLFFFLFGIVFFTNGAPMDVVDYGSKGRCSQRDLDGRILGCSPPSFI